MTTGGIENEPVAVLNNPDRPETTGRFIVIFRDEDYSNVKRVKKILRDLGGLQNLAVSTDFATSEMELESLEEDHAIHFPRLGVALLQGGEAITSLAAAASDAGSPILAVEPEYIAYPSTFLGRSTSAYIEGYRDAVNYLADHILPRDLGLAGYTSSQISVPQSFQDTNQYTWGLQATRANQSSYSGSNVRVAVLDTGFDFNHPDFQNRAIHSKSFTPGISADDIHGHGTHCAGTACGPLSPASGVMRYGISYNSEIYIGKVFNNDPKPQAPTARVIEGIDWAIGNGCQIVSMSLGVPINAPIIQYRVPIRRALQQGTLVIAAAGNNAQRPLDNGFVEPPANSEAAMAIGALDRQLRIASFSARSSQLVSVGGKVDLSAPGVDVFSSIPQHLGLHGFKNGTSMATPHVAGIAALWQEATGDTGAALWSRLLQNTRPLASPAIDVGAGLVQAP